MTGRWHSSPGNVAAKLARRTHKNSRQATITLGGATLLCDFHSRKRSFCGRTKQQSSGVTSVGSLDCRFPLTHKRGGQGDCLRRRGGVRGSGLQEGHVGREEELAAAVLAEEDGKEDSSRAALVKGRGHLVEHGVHLEGVSVSRQHKKKVSERRRRRRPP